jgi:hypothetical protein
MSPVSPHGVSPGFNSEARAGLKMRLLGVDEGNLVLWMRVEGQDVSEFRPIDKWELDSILRICEQAKGVLPLTFDAITGFNTHLGLVSRNPEVPRGNTQVGL